MSSAVSPVLPKIFEAFADYPNAAMLTKQIMGVAAASAAAGCLLGSWLANRCSHRVVLIMGYSLYVAAGVLGFVLSDLYLLLATRVVVGMTGAMVATVTLVALSNWASGNRRDVLLGALVSAALISAMIAFPAAGFLGAISWRYAFLMYLLPAPVLVACFFMPHRERPRPVVVERGARTPFSLPYRVMFIGLMCGTVSSLPAVYIPFRFRDMGIEDPRLISMSLTIYTVVAAVMSALYGRMRRVLDIYQSMAIGYGLAACGLAIIAMVPSLPVIMFGSMILGFGMGPLAPNVFALATQIPAAERARGIGIVKAIMYGAPGLGILALEPIDHAFGTPAAVATIAAISFGVVIYVLIDRVPLSDRTKQATA
jgi:MFS family permease